MHSQREADKTIFVGNLGSSVKEEILFELFLQAGPLKKVTIARDHEGRQRSYGFVYYKHAEAVPYAMALLNGTLLCGRQIKLQYSSGSSIQDGGSGPRVTKDDRDDPPHSASRSGSERRRPADTPAFHLSGCPDNSYLHQDTFHWKKTVQHTYHPPLYPPSTPPPPQLPFAPPSGVSICPSVPVPVPTPVYPRWTPAVHPQPRCRNQANLLPVARGNTTLSNRQTPHSGAEDSGKPRKHKKSREGRRRPRRQRADAKK